MLNMAAKKRPSQKADHVIIKLANREPAVILNGLKSPICWRYVTCFLSGSSPRDYVDELDLELGQLSLY